MSRDESKAEFTWKERRGSMGKLDILKNKVKERYVHKDKFLRKSRSNITSKTKGGELDEIKKSFIKEDV